MLPTYAAAEAAKPNNKPVMSESSKINSSVWCLTNHKNIPTQKPVHIGQLSNCPNFPDFGRIESNIFPYTIICVRPYEIRQNQINVTNPHLHPL